MYTFLLIIHVLVAIAIILLILLQQGKGADAGAAFGGGASSTVFGARGSSSFFSRATAILAVVFFSISLTMFIMADRQGKASKPSVDKVKPKPATGTKPVPKTDAKTDKTASPKDTSKSDDGKAPKGKTGAPVPK